MSDFLVQKELSTYFLLDAAIPKEVDRKALLKKLGAIFCVHPQNHIKLYEACHSQELEEIREVRDYYRRLRMLEYFRLFSDKKSAEKRNEELEELISIKGKVLEDIHRLHLLPPFPGNSVATLNRLSESANAGMVLAIYAYGLILCEGLGVNPSIEEGLQYLRKAAAWNSIEACIACLHYSRQEKTEYGNRLYTYLQNTPFADEMNRFTLHYKLSPEKDELAALSAKLFAHNIAKSDVYDPALARILNCVVLSEPDKQDILLSGDKGLVQSIAALPLNLLSWEGYSADCKKVPDPKSEAGKSVALALKNIDTLSSAKYRPLCICSDEHYLIKSYLKAFEEIFADCNRIVINVSALDENAYAATSNHVVLRGIREHKRNVVIFVMEGERPAPQRIQYQGGLDVQNFIQTELRKELRHQLGFHLNYAELLPIVLCDKKNVQEFRTTCQVVKLPSMDEAARRRAIEETVKDNKALYELRSLRIEDGAMKKLLSMSVNQAVDILDKFCLEFEDREDAVLSIEAIERVLEATESNPKLGFGGI